MQILYVEDNPQDVDLVRHALRRDEPQVQLQVVTTLAAARSALALPPHPDLALLDLNLPDGHGLDLLAEIRARELPMAVVTLTGQGDETLVMAALRGGADDYLAKSEHFADRVASTLRSAMASRRDDLARQARNLDVLYVEHNALDIDLTLRHFMAQAPHLKLSCVGSVAVALEKLPPQGQPGADAVDVLLIDFRLAGDSGLDLLKTVRQERGLDLPVVLVTGQGNEDVAALAMRLGATDYVVKREGYLLALPAVVENAYHRVQAQREQSALRALNQSLERKVVERTAELAAAKEAAEAANRGKTEFLARMSHDLRTPLNAVLGFSYLLSLDPAVTASSATAQKVRQVQVAGQHLLEMIDELLDLARIETGSLRLTLEPVDVRALAKDCLTLTEPLAAAHVVTVACDCDGTNARATADRLRLRQVLVNLLSNAIKYNRDGGRVDVVLGADEDTVTIEVRDTGVGMSEEQLAGLFQPFNRVGAERSGVEGTGLGLVIARQLVESMGGRLDVCSTPGVGTTFAVHLRRDRGVATPTSPVEAAAAPQPAARASGRRVLYIEDNPVNVLLMREMFTLRAGPSLEVAVTGSAGLEAVRSRRPDLVLVDLDLPDIGGLEVVRRLRADPLTATVPCVAVTALALEEDERRAAAAGCVGYLSKPFGIAELFAEIDRHLR
jgi:signal transduction histidine kinase